MDNNLVSLGSKLMTENVRGKRGNHYRNEKQELWCVQNKRKADIISLKETSPSCVF